MSIRLVALDLDGTLLQPDHTVGAASKEAIAVARQKGLRFAIVTGRMYSSATPIAAELGLDGMPIIGYNGGMVAEYPSGKVLVHEPVPLDVCLRVAAYCKERNLALQVYVDDRVYAAVDSKACDIYEEISGHRPEVVGDLTQWLTAPCTKLLIYHDAAGMPPIFQAIKETFGAEAEVMTSYPFFVEIMKPGVSKGKALAELAEQLGLTRDEVVAFGDGLNDESMIRWAGKGVAMAQAPERLRAAADLVTTAPVGEGVPQGLRLLGLI